MIISFFLFLEHNVLSIYTKFKILNFFQLLVMSIFYNYLIVIDLKHNYTHKYKDNFIYFNNTLKFHHKKILNSLILF